ncbi:uncharacterized protein LOC130625262 [Hydractinia symbiolongicarpus]|uniref:uncharacterized protein LOC130625262 n=1 Tax=Hydractinia symbiolongicarpus TaxID=13093 RepID=UPI00254C9836|nr:uncharacterized protein LOC130625262 [Hydractinia symbiolongicarpus]
MDAMEDISEKIKEYEKVHAEQDSQQSEKNEKEANAASDMRMKALETFSESKKRKDLTTEAGGEDTEKKAKKTRSSGTDTIQYLREKGEREQSLRKDELTLKKQKYEMQAAQQTSAENQQREMIQVIREQMESQRQQTQQMLMFWPI